jgi:5-enolpyruvylshikimate-3-phosphate synthase
MVNKDMMIDYAGLDNNYTFPKLQKQLKELETEAKHSFSNTQLTSLLKFANTKNYGAVKMMVRVLTQDSTADDMASLLEDIESKLNEKLAFENDKKELK